MILGFSSARRAQLARILLPSPAPVKPAPAQPDCRERSQTKQEVQRQTPVGRERLVTPGRRQARQEKEKVHPIACQHGSQCLQQSSADPWVHPGIPTRASGRGKGVVKAEGQR